MGKKCGCGRVKHPRKPACIRCLKRAELHAWLADELRMERLMREDKPQYYWMKG